MSEFRVVAGLDLGLFSDRAAVIDFYSGPIGLPFAETLQHSPTYQERFYSLGPTSLKVNYSDEPMPEGRSGYCGLEFVRPGRDQTYVDPDGLPVRLTPTLAGTDATVAVRCAVPDVDAQARFLVDGMGAHPEADGYRVGATLVRLEPSGAAADPASPTWSRGFNYVVAFVDDALAAHEGLQAYGAQHSVPPTRLADRCVFSWLRDPGGNWLELVQPASIAPLPVVTPIDERWPDIVAWRETGAAFGS